MPLELHNTLAHAREAFVPAKPERVTFYTCGPTVYDDAHIGNFRAFLVADLLRRFLESPLCTLATGSGEPHRNLHRGPREVAHVMNITDVGHMTDDSALDGGGEDKMESAARRLAESKKSGALPDGVEIDPSDPRAIADFYANRFLEDARALGLKVAHEVEDDASLMPRPTRKIREMLRDILALIQRRHAYIAASGTVYFDTQSFPEYGELSGNTLDRLRAGAGGRVSGRNQAEKKHPADFMLWKPDPTHLMRWDPKVVLADPKCPLEEGYPGWHIECSTMAIDRLGAVIDLHSGGEDNIFPHHECEIAQARGATDEARFARCWVHVRHLFVEGEKMSKSKGNFFTARELMGKGFDPGAIRFELIKTHYRVNANFTEQGLKDSTRTIERWRRFREAAEASSEEGETNERAHAAFSAAMEDDLNVAAAIGALNTWMSETPSPTRADAKSLEVFDAVLGVLDLKPDAGAEAGPPQAAMELVEQRAAAKKGKDFARADEIREELKAMGYEVKDTPEGAELIPIKSL